MSNSNVDTNKVKSLYIKLAKLSFQSVLVQLYTKIHQLKNIKNY